MATQEHTVFTEEKYAKDDKYHEEATIAVSGEGRLQRQLKNRWVEEMIAKTLSTHFILDTSLWLGI